MYKLPSWKLVGDGLIMILLRLGANDVIRATNNMPSKAMQMIANQTNFFATYTSLYM